MTHIFQSVSLSLNVCVFVQVCVYECVRVCVCVCTRMLRLMDQAEKILQLRLSSCHWGSGGSGRPVGGISAIAIASARALVIQ